MKTVVITGGSQGIGLEFVRQYLERGFHVFAASRNAQRTEGLHQLRKAHADRLSAHALDVRDEQSRRDFHEAISTQMASLDLLINNAGIISGNEEAPLPFGALEQQGLAKVFLVNAIAPLMLTECLFSLLCKGVDPVIVNITSDNGSIARNHQRGKFGYSASKAALNMITKILSLELRDQGIKVVALHPGWVKTPMTQHEAAPLDPQESVRGMIRVIESLDTRDSGSFLDWKGERIPW